MLDGNKFWTSSEISESLSPQIFDFELLTTYKMIRPNQEVTRFLIELNHPFIEEINELRTIILSSEKEIVENIKWNGPNYMFNNQDFLTMRINPPKKIQLIFHRGAKKLQQPENKLIQDASTLLVWKENDRAILELNSLDQIRKNKTNLIEIIEKWICAL
jgi:hypothetical protein